MRYQVVIPDDGSGPRRSRWAMVAVALAALAVAVPASAAPRIAIAPVKGDSRRGVGAQLKGALCATHRCVPGAIGARRPRMDRARKLGVKAVVFASFRGRRELSVALVGTDSRSLGSWSLPLGRNRRVPADRLDYLAEEIDAALGAGSAPRVAAAAPPRTRSAYDAGAYDGGEAPRANLRARAAPPAVAAAPVDVVVVPVDEPDAPPPRGADGMARYSDATALPPPFTTDAGIEAARHALRFPTNGTRPVGYVVSLNAVPRLRFEAHPIRDEGELVSAFGLFAEGAYLPGIPLAGDARNFRMSYLRLRGGVLARWESEGGIVVRPAVGWELERVSVRAGGNKRYPGLPDTSLSGPSAGLDVTVPVGRSRLSLLGSGRGIWWLQAGELAGRYFPGGKALGFEAEAGAAFRVAGSFSFRLLGSYSATRWWLQPDPTRTYSVNAALSDSWGARGMLRLEL